MSNIKLTELLSEQSFNPKAIAKKIYDAKGFVWDNEYDAVKAILSIQDKSEYAQVLKELQKLTGGRGIAQYVGSFIAIRDSANIKYGPIGIRYLKSIINHLTKIKANQQSIDIFSKKLKWLTDWYNYQTSIANQGIGQVEFAHDMFASRAMKDPEFRHSYLTTIGFAASIIPVVGWAASAGILSLDAVDQYRQGNLREAGLSVIFALIPVIGKGLSSMPAVARLGERGMAKLGYTLATSRDPVLSSIERNAISEVWKQQYVVKNGIDNYIKASLANQVASSAARDRIRDQVGKTGANIMFKIADGTIKLSALAAKIKIPLDAYSTGIDTYYELFDKYYTKPRSQELLQQLKQKANRNTMTSVDSTLTL